MTTIETILPTDNSGDPIIVHEAERKFRPDIEGLRAVAILAVVLDHFKFGVRGGFIGVDVFFVISGYLITKHLFTELTKSGRVSIPKFYARRVRRILLASTVVIISTLLIAKRYAPPLSIHGTGLDAIAAALFTINYRVAASGANYFTNTSPSLFQQFWSLAVEEQFYLLWPLLLFGVARLTRPFVSNRKALSIFLVGIICISLFGSIRLTASSPSLAYFSLQTRAWELAVGALLAINASFVAARLSRYASLLSWAGLTCIIASCFAISPSTPFPSYAALLPVFGTALVIATGVQKNKKGAELLLGQSSMQSVGRVSYSWYLWHWPILMIIPLYLGHPATRMELIAGCVGSLAVAYMSFRIVEQPIRKNQRMVANPRRGLLFGLVLILASVLTAIIVMITTSVPSANGGPEDETSSVVENVFIGTQIQKLPKILSPALANVAKESPYDCIANVEGANFEPDLPWTPACTLGNVNSKHTIVLFGDSHAWQWTKTVEAVAKQRGYRLVTVLKSACPVDTANYASNDAQYHTTTHCAAWQQLAYDRIRDSHPDLVIMTSRVFNFESTKALNDSINNVKTAGAPIAWLTDTPQPGSNIPNCLSQHPNDVQSCSFSRSSGLGEAKLRKKLNDEAAHAGARVIDVMPWFCTDTTCPAFVANKVVYFDDSHMTNAYSLKLASTLEAELADLLPKK